MSADAESALGAMAATVFVDATTEPAENSTAPVLPPNIVYVVTVPVLFGLMTLIGTVGNSLVIYVIIVQRRMRTVTNLLLLNLSLADLSFVLICPPFTAYELVTTDGWPFGVVICKLMHYLLNVTAYVTVYTLVLISVMRYMTIVHNASTVRVRTRRNTVLATCAIWVVMLVVNVPILIAFDVRHVDGLAECNHYGQAFGQRFYANFFTFAYVLPLLVIAALSVSILHHIHQHRPSTMSKKTKAQTKKRQASRLIILVVVIFALFWLPVHIHLLIAYFGNISTSAVYRSVSLLWYCLAYFNSCVNPIIYTFASQEFRDGFRKAIACRRLDSRTDDEAATTYTTAVEHKHNGTSVELLAREAPAGRAGAKDSV